MGFLLLSVPKTRSRTERDELKHRLNAARAYGQRLDQGIQRTLEESFGLDLSAVRIHTGRTANALARAVGAEAFTCGADIFFAADAYRPQTKAGLWLLAHEVVHVIQQARGGVSDPLATPGVVMGVAGNPWENEADDVAAKVVEGRPVSIASGLDTVASADAIGRAARPMIIQCHDSFEHRALGDVSSTDLRAIATNGSQRTEILNREIQLLWQWHQNPEAVTEAQIKQLCPWINTLRLNASGLLVTYGELNALPDYIATPTSVDAIPKNVLLPLLQFIRQEGYIQLNKLLNRTVSDAFQYAAYAPWQQAPSILNKLLESQSLDTLTQGLGIKGVNHYSGLLARNACHFAPYSWYRWQSSYLIARDLAKRAHDTTDPNERARLTYQAWIYHGYADHFLQDSFAAGHLVNKTLIMQWFIEWAANQSLVPVADWDFVKYITTSLQPGLAGRQLYNPGYNGMSNDPQTAEDQPTYTQRLQTTGVVPGAAELDTSYQNYLTFLSSLITQSSSASIHDYYNSHSLWVGSVAHPAAYEVWGDATLLSGSNGGDGVQFTSETAQMSQQSIRDLLASGQTSITTQQIRDHFPTTVRSNNNQMISLEAWNDTQKSFCASTIFPGLHDIIVRIVSPRIANVSQDQDLTARWSTSLPSSGFTVTSILNANNRVFVGSNGYVYELDPTNGQVLYQLRVTGSIGVGDYETRLATNGQILFVGVHGYVYGIALSDWSRVAWEASLPSAGYTVVDVLNDNNRLFAASNGYVYELNPSNGQVLHKLLLASIFGTGDYTSSLATNGQLLFIGTHGYVYGLNLSNWSRAAWEASLPSAGYTLVDVLNSNNRLFAGSNGYVYELNPNSGQVLHSLRVTDALGVGDYTTRLATNGQMLFVGVHGYVYGVNLSNWSGAAWTADLTGNRYTNANVVSFNKQLLAGSYGSIYRIDPTNGKIIRSVLVSSVVGAGNYETRIATNDGQVLFVGVHGYAYAVSLLSPTPNAIISYRAHVQNIGWQDWVQDGQVAGTTGQSLRMEAIQIQLNTVLPEFSKASVRYRAHVQNIGWQDWVQDGQVAGTTGQGLRMEAIQIDLGGNILDNYHVGYRAHVQNVGWQDWVQDGQVAGTTGQSLRMEAIQIEIVQGPLGK
jgi:hypothetical protein